MVENQYLLYLDWQITRDDLDNLNDEWLNQHGVKLDISELLNATKQPIAASGETKKPKPEPLPTHIVQADPKIGQRETWSAIATQYGLSARELLSLNPQYNADPMLLKVGDTLQVQAPPQASEPPPVYGLPLLKPQIYNQAFNTLYDYSKTCLNSSSLVPITHKNWLKKDVPMVKIRDLSPCQVFTKSYKQPINSTTTYIEPEPIKNFGPWAFFFGQANANPLVIPAIEAIGAGMAASAGSMGSSRLISQQADAEFGSPDDRAFQYFTYVIDSSDKEPGTLYDFFESYY